MIEFENAITDFARWFAANVETSKFEVTWTATCKPVNSHIGEHIYVEWHPTYGNRAEDEYVTDNARFKRFASWGHKTFDCRRTATWTVMDGWAMTDWLRKEGA